MPSSEEERLMELLEPIKTLQDAFNQFGSPDLEAPSILRYSPDDPSSERPPITEVRRAILYEALSKFANVRIIEREHGGVFWNFEAKQIDDATS